MGKHCQFARQSLFVQDPFDIGKVLSRASQPGGKLRAHTPLHPDGLGQLAELLATQVLADTLQSAANRGLQYVARGIVFRQFSESGLNPGQNLFQLSLLALPLGVVSFDPFREAFHVVNQADIVPVVENDFVLIVLAKNGNPKSDRFVEISVRKVGSQFVESEALAKKG